LYSAKGIIIDLRQNRGGETDVAWYLLQHIIKDKYFLNFAWQTRINNGVKRTTGNFIEENADFLNNKAYQTFLPDTIYIPDSIKQFDCPVVILTSNNTCSAAEDFLIILKERPDRPLFIGQATMGSTGSPLMLWNFPENAMARICARRVLYPYSLKPFTEGIEPDIQVDYTLDEFINQETDKEIEVAFKELEKQMNK
jgi:C-terminal processing protease CtpA/Prc